MRGERNSAEEKAITSEGGVAHFAAECDCAGGLQGI